MQVSNESVSNVGLSRADVLIPEVVVKVEEVEVAAVLWKRRLWP